MAERESVALPKFGSWDVNNPAATQYSMIFDRARDEKRAGQPQTGRRDSARGGERLSMNKRDPQLVKLSSSKRWLCCSSFKYAES